MASDFDRWVEEARTVSIESEIARRNILLKKSGVERIGPCPKCGGTDRFSINTVKGIFNCRGCNKGGDVIALVQLIDGCNFTEAVETLTQKPKPKGNGADVSGTDTPFGGNGHSGGRIRSKDEQLGPIVAIYSYEKTDGKLAFQVLRYEPPNGKTFRQRVPDGNSGWIYSTRDIVMLPYHLQELQEAIGNEQIIFLPEGEKDVDNLRKLGLNATCNPRGAGKWASCNIDMHFVDAHVVIIADNDPQSKNSKTGQLLTHADGRPRFAGWDHAQDVAKHLFEVAADVRVIDLKLVWAECPDKGDISDWIAAGGSVEALNRIVEQTPEWQPGDEKLLPITALDGVALTWPIPIDETKISPRDWIVPGLLMRKQVTVLVAPSGSGKSLLTLQLGLACTQKLAWAGWHPRRICKVLLVNSEDDHDEMRRRLAAAFHVMPQLKKDESAGRLAFADQTTDAIIAKFDTRSKTLVRTPLLEKLVEIIIKNGFDIVFVDPFAETFQGDENSNSELKWAGILWREVARRTGAAVCLVHHTKKYATGMAGDVDAARGAGALIGIARIVSTLFPMNDKEAAELLVSENDKNRAAYLRYDDAKANLNLVSTVAKWFRKQTITLNNKTDDLPADDVGALVPWKPKGPLDGIDDRKIHAFFSQLDRGIINDDGEPTGEFWTLDTRKQSEAEMSRYVGDFVETFFEVTTSAAIAMVTAWRKKGAFTEDKYKSPRTRKMRTRVRSRNAAKSTTETPSGDMEQGPDSHDPELF